MHPLISHLRSTLVCGAAGVACALAVTAFVGCAKNEAPKPQRPSYMNIGLRGGLPPYLKDTVLERTDLSNTGPLAVSTFGLVVNLRYSGDSNAPTAVREWMIKEMYRHGMGGKRIPGYEDMTPERALSDNRNAIVIVGAYIPPGARKGQRVDAYCQALPQSNTASLAGGTLYQCELRLLGANPIDPGGSVNKYIEARGPLFVNPAFALETPQPGAGAARSGARTATVMGGGILTTDRAVQLRLRTPQWNISRALEIVINTRFQEIADRPRQDGRGMCVAEAQDEGYLNLYVPMAYQGDWEHFVGVVNHLYINLNPAVAAIKAQELAEAAKQPGAMLEDISFAFEALGKVAVPYLTPLLGHPSADVQYAAARAGAYLGDIPSEDTLLSIARTQGNPFRLNAIVALGGLPNNPEINRTLASCLDSDESLLRVSAYKILAKNSDPSIASMRVGTENFILDTINCKGPPLIYATRTGEPRLAVFGPKTAVQQPMTFAAFDTTLTITSDVQRPNLLSVFYRGEQLQQPVKTLSRPYVAELAARLGGAGDEKLHFSYGDVIGILQSLADRGKVTAAFMLQDQPGVEDALADTHDTTGNGLGGNVGRPVGEPAPPPPAHEPQGTVPLSPSHDPAATVGENHAPAGPAVTPAQPQQPAGAVAPSYPAYAPPTAPSTSSGRAN